MIRVVFLDTAPLGILTNPTHSPLTHRLLQWSIELLTAGNKLVVPAIADFELRRELLRMGSTKSLQALDAFHAAAPDRYLPLTDSALKRAALLWAQARSIGKLPADPKELNGDVLIAAQILDYQAVHFLPTTNLIVATVNVGHLALFVPAARWSDIPVEENH